MPRGASSTDDVAMLKMITGASCPWNLFTVPTDITGIQSFNVSKFFFKFFPYCRSVANVKFAVLTFYLFFMAYRDNILLVEISLFLECNQVVFGKGRLGD